jgi:hypothetical protein
MGAPVNFDRKLNNAWRVVRAYLGITDPTGLLVISPHYSENDED